MTKRTGTKKGPARPSNTREAPVGAAGAPDNGPTMSQAGAMPSGSQMGHWNTAMPNPDATRPGTMPKSMSTSRKDGTGRAKRK